MHGLPSKFLNGSSHNHVNMHAVIRRWGGSLAIRLDPEASRRQGLREDMDVEVEIRAPPIDFAALPTVDDDVDAAERHDELLHARD
jgi:antitoxin component of MazEF toxin-antitoxin module